MDSGLGFCYEPVVCQCRLKQKHEQENSVEEGCDIKETSLTFLLFYFILEPMAKHTFVLISNQTTGYMIKTEQENSNT